ncbi:MAG: ABC transporter permease [Acidobacteriota bacterium]
MTPSGAALPSRPGLLVPVLSLLRREMIRFLRQRSRVFGALGQPILFWILLGSGFGASFRPPGAAPRTSYMAWFFPGIVVMVVLFTAIFSTISIIEDRKEGFLQAVLVAPVPRMAIVLGKILGGTLLAVGQGAILLLASPLVGLPLRPVPFLLSVAALTGMAFALTAVGLAIAWRMDSTQGFHMVMNLFLLPMWLLSGALFPVEGTPLWLRVTMKANPLTYGVALLRHAMAGAASSPHLPPVSLCLMVTVLFCLLTLGISTSLVHFRRQTG